MPSPQSNSGADRLRPLNLPVLDRMVDNLYGVYGVTRLVSGYTGNIFRIQEVSGGTSADFAANSAGLVNWPAIARHIQGTTGRVTIWYDQSGNGRNLVPPDAARSPTIRFSGRIPLVIFVSASTQFFNNASGLAFAQNQAAVSLACVVKHDTIPGTQQAAIGVSNNASAARAVMNTDSTGGARAGGRRLDADSFVGSTGFAADTNWHARIARFDVSTAKIYHRMDDQTETLDPFQTAGNFSNTASGSVQVGAIGGGNTLNGQMTCAVLIRDLLTDAETIDLTNALQRMKP